jgi:hypothetical protein
VSQLWELAYGRALLIKTGLLFAALLVGIWRRRWAELALVVVIVAAVAVLVLERPGRNAVAARKPVAAVPAQPSPEPPAQPRGALVLAHEAGIYGVALALEPRRLTVTVLSPAGGGMRGLDVRVDGSAAVACGSGCYRVESSHGRRVRVSLDGDTSVFTVPARAQDATTLVRRLGERFRAHRSVDFLELLSSAPGHGISARWRLEQPDRLSYSIADGAQAIVIGRRRWDRLTPRGPWSASAQTPLSQPATQWARATNAHLLDASTVAFVDPTTPAFFTVHFDPKTLRPSVLQMTAAAHFMTDAYVRFDSGRALRPPR